MYIFLTVDVTIFFNKFCCKFLPNSGIALRLIAIASNGPSHKTNGKFQLINNSNGIISLDVSGLRYLTYGSFSNDLPVK